MTYCVTHWIHYKGECSLCELDSNRGTEPARPDGAELGAAAGSANDGTLRSERKWCAWCGKWGNHTSGGCDDLHAERLERRRANEGDSPSAKLSEPRPEVPDVR